MPLNEQLNDLSILLDSHVGPLRLALLPAEIESAELSRIIVVDRYWLEKHEWNAAQLLAHAPARA